MRHVVRVLSKNNIKIKDKMLNNNIVDEAKDKQRGLIVFK